jgi:hypothetical protein
MPRPRKNASEEPRTTAPRPFAPKVTLALDAETERILHEAMAAAGVKSKSRMVRYCVAAALGNPLQKAAIFETEIWLRQLSVLVFRKFMRKFATTLPEIVEEVLLNAGGDEGAES